jgi:phosphinothricin acetyltransferase
MRLTHRIARRQDLERIVAIYNAAIPSRIVTADTAPITVASRESWFAEHDPAHRPLWVAEHQDGVVGWLSVSCFVKRPAYDVTAEVSVYIDADYRRRGIGRYLLAQAIAAAPGLGIETLLALVFGSNLPSLALFERFGFARWGLLPAVARMDGSDRDVVILGRRLI